MRNLALPTAPCLFTFPKVIAFTEDMPRDEWLALRKPHIGGSQAAPSNGMSRWTSQIALYYEKTEDTSKTFGPIQEAKMESGNWMEPVIAAWFAHKTGKQVVRQPYYFEHPEHSFMGANIDFAIMGENAGLECKNTAYGDAWDEEDVPDDYYFQCQHYMAVTGAKKWYLAVCINGWQFKYYDIERDDMFIAAMTVQEAAFWKMVQDRTPPAFDGSDSAKALLASLYPSETKGSTMDLPGEADDLFDRRAELKEQEKEVKAGLAEVENQLKAMIGENEVGLSARYIFKYATINKKEYTVKASSYRQMNVKARV